MGTIVTNSKVCAICGNEYTYKRSHSIYCSRKCKDTAQRIREKTDNEKVTTRICHFCGVKYTSHQSSSIYCSKNCKEKAYYKKRQHAEHEFYNLVSCPFYSGTLRFEGDRLPDPVLGF
jgi:uncharacterized Zn ribbon protein